MNPHSCPRCGALRIPAREVTGMRGLTFCGIECHDVWDRVMFGIDRRPEPEIMKRMAQLADLEDAAIINAEEVGRIVLAYFRQQKAGPT